jgi:hypothetical protein
LPESLLWVVDPQMQTITIYRSTTEIKVHVIGDVIEAYLLPALVFPVASAFP